MTTLNVPKSRDANIWEDTKSKQVIWDVRLRRPNGTKFRRNGVAPDKKDARKKRDAAFQEFNQEISAVQSSLTVSQWGSTCLEEIWPPDIREKSLITYRQMLQTHVYPLLGEVKLGELNAEQLQLYFNRLSESSLSRGTVLKIRTVFSSLLTRAIQHSHMRENPLRYVRVKAGSEDEFEIDKRILTVAERDALLCVSSGTYIHAAVTLALKMGLRLGECLGLQWDEVNFQTPNLRIRSQIQRIRGKGLVQLPPKTKAGFRTIKIPPSVRAVLVEEKSHSNSSYVVSNGSGGPLEPSRLRRIFGDCCWIAGLMSGTDFSGKPVPDPSFHDLRSTFLSSMANEKKVEPRTLMQIAGHSNIEVTLQHYVRSSDEHIGNAMDLVD